MAHSILTYPGSAGFGPYVANFTLGYLRPEFVKVRVNNEVDGLGDPVYRDFILNGTLLTITSGVQPVGTDTVQLIRTMLVDQLIHDYSDGAVIMEENLDDSNLQSIMLIQQFLDGRIEAPLSVNLNMGGFRVVNMAPAIDGTDAVNLTQMNSAIEGVIAGNATGRVKIDGGDTFGYLGEKVVGDGTAIDVDKVGDQLVISYAGIVAPLDNTMAITDPTVTDDEDSGYSVGSRWFNLATNEVFICLRADAGIAVWVDITFNLEDLAPLLAAKSDKLVSYYEYDSSSTAHTAVSDDTDRVNGWAGTSTKTLTLPNIGVGSVIVFTQVGTGAIVAAAGAGMTLNIPAGMLGRTRAANCKMVLHQTSSTTWDIGGDLGFLV